MAEPITRGLTTEELSLVAAGLQGLGRLDAAHLAVEIRNAAAVAVVQKAPKATPIRQRLASMFPDREIESWSATWDSDRCEPSPGDIVTAWFLDGGSADVSAITWEVL